LSKSRQVLVTLLTPALRVVLGSALCLLLTGCDSPTPDSVAEPTSASGNDADLVFVNGHVYSLSWPAPSGSGIANPQSPRGGDAQGLAVKDGLIIGVGTNTAMKQYVGRQTKVIDLGTATLVPGLVDSHTHVFELGRKLEQVDLTGASDEAEAVARVAARAASVPAGDWIIGHGWDEGAWANNYPDKQLLTEQVPNHPVLMQSLHGFAVWGNQRALAAASIDAATPTPVGGEIHRLDNGEPSGLLLNRATQLLRAAVPQPSAADLRRQVSLALTQMATDGYVGVHEAGTTAEQMAVLRAMEADEELPLRFYAMLSLRDEALMERWIERGPDKDNDSMLVTRAVKGYYDGALGSRGAHMLADYSDQPGHNGISGADYAFNAQLAKRALAAGFQLAIHAIGDAGNRFTLDFIEQNQHAVTERHRIEHAQVIHSEDIVRFGKLGVIASMQPPHAVEDMAWAEERVGEERIRGAYAWRTLREANARIIFNSDNPGSDHDIFYGLHAAVTRRDKSRLPKSGWRRHEAVTVEEAVRAYSQWAAFASFREAQTGQLAPGYWADLTVLNIDPFQVAAVNTDELLSGEVLMTVVGGEVVYDSRQDGNAQNRAEKRTNRAPEPVELIPALGTDS